MISHWGSLRWIPRILPRGLPTTPELAGREAVDRDGEGDLPPPICGGKGTEGCATGGWLAGEGGGGGGTGTTSA